jgi:hypothetical protein
LLGLGLIALHLFLLFASPKFAYAVPVAEQPVLWFVGPMLAGGALLLLIPGIAAREAREARGAGLLLWILLVGIALRVIMLPSTPILESDFNRYLWDGAVLAEGLNPYSNSPQEVIDNLKEGDTALTALAVESKGIVARFNYPELRTVYPPLAQGFFALSHWLGPWSLEVWRAVLIAAELATFALLVLLLGGLGRSPLWAALYWWHPLAVKEAINSAHMDALLLPFLLGALLLALRGRGLWATGTLALAAGVKLWPILLLPLFLRPMLERPRRLAAALGLFTLLLLVLYSPVFAAGFDWSSGFVAYARHWQMNDALFMSLLWALEGLGTLFAWDGAVSRLVARAIMLAAIVGLALWLARKPSPDAGAFVERCLLLTAAVFLLSPAQFPWYGLWFLPFLALRPRFSLLLLAALLPLYYLRFHFEARGAVSVFDQGIVWLEYIPVWALLAWEGWRARKGAAAPPAKYLYPPP